MSADPRDPAASPAPSSRQPRWRPWEGRAAPADRVIVTGIALRTLYGLAMLPLIPLLLAPHPLLLQLLSGSSVAQVVVGAQVRVGAVSWPVAILAGLPVWVLFDWLYWWAGRRWGDRALTLVLARDGRPGAARRAARMEAVVARFGPYGVLLARFLPVPAPLTYAAAGLAGMRLGTFLVLHALGTTAAVVLTVGLGWALGARAVDVVEQFDRYALLATLAVVAVLLVVGLTRRRRTRVARG